MKAVSLNFEIHQPFRLKRYRFFDIGNDHYYYDDFLNDDIVTRIAHQSYIPAAETLLRMINDTKGAFRCSISITGVAIEQFEQYVPEFIDLLRRLADTGKVEFIATPYAHSLASLYDPEEFRQQVEMQCRKLHELFGVKPKVFRNTELIYSDDIAPQILGMGFKGCITEGVKHILGWKSADYVYSAASAPKLKLLLKNDKLSDDIAFRFSDTSWDAFPLTADKYMDWIAATPPEEQIINLCLNLETFGSLQPASSGILQFLEALPRFANERGIEFWTPSDAESKLLANLQSCMPSRAPTRPAILLHGSAMPCSTRLSTSSTGPVSASVCAKTAASSRIGGIFRDQTTSTICRPSTLPMVPCIASSVPTRLPTRLSQTI